MKDKTVAALLAFFIGWAGIHKFYLGKSGAGVVYLLFFWTGIPALIAFFECIFLLMMSESDFNAKYNRRFQDTASTSRLSHESSKDKAGTLQELRQLYEAQIITAEEYEEKRRKILDSI